MKSYARKVMPITKKWTVEKLMAALRDFPLRNRERLTFEYVWVALTTTFDMPVRWWT